MPRGFQAFSRLLGSGKGRIMRGEEFTRCILRAKEVPEPGRGGQAWAHGMCSTSGGSSAGPGPGCQLGGGCS